MRWVSVFFFASAMCALPACADVLGAALERGAQLQRSGQAADALRCFQEARVECPESIALIFAMGGAEAALGDSLLEDHDLDGAKRQFASARETFGRCNGDPHFAETADYNAATCLLRVDTVLERQGDYEARVGNLKAAVDALAALAAAHPDHERAAKNLECARYRLALLLQEPPADPSTKEEEKPEDDEQPASEVAGATTQIPDATVEVEDGAIVVLRMKARGEASP